MKDFRRGLVPGLATNGWFIIIFVTDQSESIGMATMGANGVVVLYLCATGPHGLIGDGQVTYSPSDPKYQEVLNHLGGLKPGQSKPVPPWSDAQ